MNPRTRITIRHMGLNINDIKAALLTLNYRDSASFFSSHDYCMSLAQKCPKNHHVFRSNPDAKVPFEQSKKVQDISEASETNLSQTLYVLRTFLDQTVRLNILGELPQKDLYERYREYCMEYNQPVLTRKGFGPKVLKYFELRHNITLEKTITQRGRVFMGIEYINTMASNSPEIEKLLERLAHLLFSRQPVAEETFRKIRELLAYLTENS